MGNKEQDPNKLGSIPHERSEPRPDFSQPLPRAKLPEELQKRLNDEESLWSTLYDGTAGESTDSSVRYAAYASRLRTIMLSAHRYVAYTSDIGESFRPIAHPYLIKGAYGVSWAYLAGDVMHEGYKAYLGNQRILKPEGEGAVPGRIVPIEDYRAVMAQRAVFQTFASMALPAFTIHSIVRYSGRALKQVKNPTIRTWGPIGLGLAAVPALPYLFDKPVEEATEYIFHKVFQAVGGPEAVGHSPETGRADKLQQKFTQKAADEKKEL